MLISAVTAHASELAQAQAITSSSMVATIPPCTLSLQPTKSSPAFHEVRADPSLSSMCNRMPIGFEPPHAKQL